MRQPHVAYQLTATDLLVISLSLKYQLSCPSGCDSNCFTVKRSKRICLRSQASVMMLIRNNNKIKTQLFNLPHCSNED